MIRPTRIAAALTLVAAPALAQPAPAPHLKVAFETGAATGTIRVALFDSEAAYGGGAPVASAIVDVAAGEREAAFEDLPAGRYAFKAFHDVNGNGRMDVNPFGMPVEPFAFSNNAVGNMGPAGWERASLDLTADTVQTVRIR